jgi:hypothetical protein
MDETSASTAHRTQYEFAAAHTPDSGPTPLEAAMAAEEEQARDCGPHCPILPQQLRKVMVAIMAACDNNEKRIAICITRFGGMSLSQVGARFGGITKQGVRNSIHLSPRPQIHRGHTSQACHARP